MNDRIVPLAWVGSGGRGRVVELHGGAEFQERVVSLGLRAGSEVEVIAGGATGGRVLVAVGDTRIGLGHGMAEKILVAIDGAGP